MAQGIQVSGGAPDDDAGGRDDDVASSNDVIAYYRTIREDDPEIGEQVRGILRALAVRVATRKAQDRVWLLGPNREVGEA